MERLSRTLLRNLGFKADFLFFCKLSKFDVSSTRSLKCRRMTGTRSGTTINAEKEKAGEELQERESLLEVRKIER